PGASVPRGDFAGCAGSTPATRRAPENREAPPPDRRPAARTAETGHHTHRLCRLMGALALLLPFLRADRPIQGSAPPRRAGAAAPPAGPAAPSPDYPPPALPGLGAPPTALDPRSRPRNRQNEPISPAPVPRNRQNEPIFGRITPLLRIRQPPFVRS